MSNLPDSQDGLGFNKRALLVVLGGVFAVCAAIAGVSFLWERALSPFLSIDELSINANQIRTQVAIELTQTALARDLRSVSQSTATLHASTVGLNSTTPTFEAFCAFLTREQLEYLRNIQSVEDAIDQAEQYAGSRQNDYQAGEIIPANVVIATDLLTTDFDQFGVVSINNQGGWGLFLTTRDFQAPNAGTYWCLR